jgi:hypothetical protein
MKKMFVLVLALVMAFAALPAFAQDKADWAFYGSVRMWTAWESVDADTPVALSSAAPAGFFSVATTNARAVNFGTAAAPNWQDDDEIAWELQGNSRFGANVKWGNIGGRVEYGHTSTANLRLLYGTWNFGSGTLLLGQDYGPYFYLVSGLCGPGGAECNGIGFGSIYSGRNPQLKLIFGGLQFALVKSQKTSSFQPGAFAFLPDANARAQQAFVVSNQANAAASGFRDLDQTLPKLEASYTFNWGPGQFFVGGAYNTYDERYSIGGAEKDVTVDGWVLGAGTKLSFGPFYTNATFQFGSNVNNSGTGPATLFPSVKIFNPATNAETDSDYLAAQLILGFKLTDSMVFEGGLIYQTGLFDTGLGDFEQSQLVYYIGFGWSPAKNVFIVPEIGVIDYDSIKSPGIPDIEFGKLSWFGIKWQINF